MATNQDLGYFLYAQGTLLMLRMLKTTILHHLVTFLLWKEELLTMDVEGARVLTFMDLMIKWPWLNQASNQTHFSLMVVLLPHEQVRGNFLMLRGETTEDWNLKLVTDMEFQHCFHACVDNPPIKFAQIYFFGLIVLIEYDVPGRNKLLFIRPVDFLNLKHIVFFPFNLLPSICCVVYFICVCNMYAHLSVSVHL